MNTERLLELYDRISEAPDAVARLRRFMLDLAVRGKLVEQDPADEPAAELLKRIEKESWGQGGIPRNWRSAKVGAVLSFQYGKGLKASERADEGPVPVFGSNGIVGYTDEPLTDRPAIIVGRKGSAGALNLCDGPSWTTDVAYFVEAPSFFDLRFLFVALSALNLDTLGKGVKPGLSRSDAYEQIIRVPPLAEQHRIVAKVDELMALCDRLEEARTRREAFRDRLTTASVARLTAPDTDAETFRSHARFALATLPALTTRPDQIKPLRQTILNLAVHGKLVDQDLTDEPASELLKRIAEEKAEHIRRKEIRRKKVVDPVDEKATPFPVPATWEWCRLGNLFNLVTDGAHHTPRYIDAGVPFLSVKDVSSGRIRFDDVRYISNEQHEELCKRCHPERGDILLTKVGTTGIAVPVETDRSFSIFVSVALLKFSKQNLSQKYLCHLINSPFVRLQSAENTQGIGNQNLVLRLINEFALPIPPLAEQHRIVARVDELMALCDQLEAALSTADTTKQRLLEALLHEALAPAATPRETEAA